MSSEQIDPNDPLVRRALTVVRLLRDPAFPGLILMIILILGGFAGLAFGWRGVARTIYVPLQVPEIVSGGIAGLALIGVGVALFDLQMWRRDAAGERRLTDDLLDEVAGLVALAPEIKQRVRKRP
jgi:hypothetical protein